MRSVPVGNRRIAGLHQPRLRSVRHQPRILAGTMNPAQHLLLLHPRTVPEPAFQQQEQAMQYPKPFTVYQPIPGQSVKPLFTVHAYSLEQARAIVAATIPGETLIVGPVGRDGASR